MRHTRHLKHTGQVLGPAPRGLLLHPRWGDKGILVEPGWSHPAVKASVCFQGPYSHPTPRVSKSGEHAILCKSIKSHPTGRQCPSWEGGRGWGGKCDRGLQGEHARLGCAQLRLASSSAGVLASSGGDQMGGRLPRQRLLDGLDGLFNQAQCFRAVLHQTY